MKSFQSLLPAFGLVAAVQALNNWSNTTSEAVVWTTVTTDIYTTFCPDSTTFTQGTKTYTATASETLTITDCPCTIKTTKPAPPPTKSATCLPPPVWTTTTVVSSYTTYCPAPTSVVQGNKTYTVTEATTLTISNCPCTLTTTYEAKTYPVPSSGVVTIPTVSTYKPSYLAPPGTGAPSIVAGITTSASKTQVSPASATTSGPLQVHGNVGSKADAGMGVLGAAGLAALLL